MLSAYQRRLKHERILRAAATILAEFIAEPQNIDEPDESIARAVDIAFALDHGIAQRIEEERREEERAAGGPRVQRAQRLRGPVEFESEEEDGD